MNYSGLADYRKLLEFGLRKFDTETLNSSIETHTLESNILSQLKKLNNYVFTYYSTNEDDVTYSLEFAIFADFLKPLTDILKAKGLWYMSKNYKTNEYDEWFSENHDDTESEVKTISRNDKDKFYINDEPMSWKIHSENTNTVQIKREKYIYFLNSEWIEDSNYKQVDNLFTDLYSNHYHKSMFESLANNVGIITIEDPVIGRETLYREVYTILRDIMNPILYPYIRHSSENRKGRRKRRQTIKRYRRKTIAL